MSSETNLVMCILARLNLLPNYYFIGVDELAEELEEEPRVIKRVLERLFSSKPKLVWRDRDHRDTFRLGGKAGKQRLYELLLDQAWTQKHQEATREATDQLTSSCDRQTLLMILHSVRDGKEPSTEELAKSAGLLPFEVWTACSSLAICGLVKGRKDERGQTYLWSFNGEGQSVAEEVERQQTS